MKAWKFVAIACCATALSAPASAGLIGTTVDVGYYFPDTSTAYASSSANPASFMIGAGVESVVDVEGVTDISVDFGDTTLTVLFNTVLSSPTWTAGSFNGLIFSGAGLATIAGIAVLPSSTLAGFDASRATRVGEQLLLDWNGLDFADGRTLDLEFTLRDGVGVPEPAAWSLLLLGIAAAARSRLARGGGSAS